jgi:hypothetical protein
MGGNIRVILLWPGDSSWVNPLFHRAIQKLSYEICQWRRGAFHVSNFRFHLKNGHCSASIRAQLLAKALHGYEDSLSFGWADWGGWEFGGGSQMARAL